MNENLRRWATVVCLSALVWPGIGVAQMHHHTASADSTTAHDTLPPGFCR